MGDWLASLDAQCKAEGIEQVEGSATNEKEPTKATETSGMNEIDEKKDAPKTTFGGSFGSSKTVGGGFGSAKPLMNPPPQTSFGATSANRIGTGSVSPNSSSTHDGRGPAIGSPDFENGGGNIISVGVHKPAPACKPVDNASSTNNARVTSTLKVSRFGELAHAQIGNEIRVGSRIPRVGGGYGTPESVTTKKITHFSETQKVVIGGGFGSKNSTVGGGFGTRKTIPVVETKEPIIENTVKPVEVTKPVEKSRVIGGGFGGRNNVVPRTENISPVVNESVLPANNETFVIPTKQVEIVSQPEKIEEKVVPRMIGGGFGKVTSNPELKCSGGGFGAKKQVISSQETEQTKPVVEAKRPVGGGFGTRRMNNTTMTVPPSPIPDSIPNSPRFSQVSTPPPQASPIGNRFMNDRSEDLNNKTNSNQFDFSNSKEAFNPPTPVENQKFRFGSGDSFRKENVPSMERKESFNNLGNFNKTFTKLSTAETEKENTGMFAPAAQPSFQQFSGGRGRGGPIDYAGQGQQHSMNQVGRGQFVSRGPNQSFQQNSARPPFANNNGIANGQGGFPRHESPKFVQKSDEAHDKASLPADIALLNKYIHREVKMMKNANVDIQRSDPTSPLYSIGSFRELRLKPEVLTALDCLGFDFPTKIQETALPLLLMEPPSNLIAQAQSGTGKTAAFVLTMLCRIDMEVKCPQCICIAPTLELAKQIGEVVTKMGQFIQGLSIHYAIKGANMAEMRNKTIQSQIVIGTPGITRDYLMKYKCIDPSQIRCLVLDEADVMLYQQGFADISTSIYNLIEEKSSNVQSMLFSATYDAPVIEFATKLVKNAIVVMLKKEEQALPNIKQFYVECANRMSKFEAIVNLYSGLTVASSVIFCYTKSSVAWLCENMRMRGHQADCLHGDMTVVERADIITRFKNNEFRVLITTSVLSRGIDVPQVSVVINYDLPVKYDTNNQEIVIDGQKQPDCETYLHRIGRTGRFGKMGIAINFVDDANTKNMIGLLENHFEMKIGKMDPSNLLELEEIEKSTYIR